MMRLTALTILSTVLPGAAGFQRPADVRPVSIAIKDARGADVRPLDIQGKRAALLFFVQRDCPIANKFAPEIGRICAAYEPRGVGCYVVYIEPDISGDEAARHAREYKLRGRALLDAGRRLVAAAGATVTPEAAVFLPGGKVAYRGRIDDRYPALGKWRYPPTKHELRDALDAVLAGKLVNPRFTHAVGCFISQVSTPTAKGSRESR